MLYWVALLGTRVRVSYRIFFWGGGGEFRKEGHICDRLRENRAQRGMRKRRKKIDLVLKIVLNKPNEGNG